MNRKEACSHPKNRLTIIDTDIRHNNGHMEMCAHIKCGCGQEWAAYEGSAMPVWNSKTIPVKRGKRFNPRGRATARG